jgi:hypothetical protein
LQIWPWFLNYTLRVSDEIILQDAVSQTTLEKFIATGKVAFFKTLFTPVDAIAAFEKVLLHEITHTRAGTV